MRKGIVGVGNMLLGDEGVGVHCISKLQQMNVPDDIVIFDGGTEGYGLMDMISGFDQLVMVDCIRGGAPPGTMYRFAAGEVRMVQDIFHASIHQVGICQVLNTLTLVGRAPHTVIVGMEPECLDIGMRLSKTVQRRLCSLTELVLHTICNFPIDVQKIGRITFR